MLNKIENLVFSKQKITRILFFLFLLSFFPSDVLFAQDVLPKFEKNIKHDQRPTDLEYALMSNLAYSKEIGKGSSLREAKLIDWKVHEIRTGANDYKGVVFENLVTCQLVVAHKGTSPTSVDNLIEDLNGIVRNTNSPQKTEAFVLTMDMIKYATENGYHLSFTGHSLGAFLDELSVFYCHNHNYPMVNAVTFESPGSQESMEVLQSNIKGQRIDLNKLDIINYVASPNKINTLNHHVGNMYQLETHLDDRGMLNYREHLFYTLETHSMDKIVNYFLEGSENNYPLAVSDWPVSSLKDFLVHFIKDESVLQQSRYFEYVDFDKECNCYRIKDKGNKLLFELTYNAHYQQLDYDTRVRMPLIHFNQEMQKFLQLFNIYKDKLIKDEYDKQNLIKQFKRVNIPDEITNYLLDYRLIKDKAGNLDVHLVGKEANNIYQFRNKLSWYLQNSSNLQAIENVMTESIKNRCDISQLNNVPSPVNYLQDRKEIGDIQSLIDRCGNKLCLIYITGFSGSGKTQLALKYAHDHEQNYYHTRFFDASDQQKLLGGFESLARSLCHEDLKMCSGLQEYEYKNCVIDIVKRCLKELPDTSRFLWIFDNAKKSNELEKYLPDEQNIKGVILITTKKKGEFVNQGEVVDLNQGLTESETCSLLRKIVQENIGRPNIDSICNDEEIKKIAVDFWHNLPLPISYTGVVIGKLKSCEKYMSMYYQYPRDIEGLAKDLHYRLQSEAIQQHIPLLDKLDLEISGLLVFVQTPFLKDLAVIYIGTNDVYRKILNFAPISEDDKLKLYNGEINIIDDLRISEKIKHFELIKGDETNQLLSFPHELFVDEIHKFLLKKDEEDPGSYKRLFDQVTEFLCQKFTGSFWDDHMWDNEKIVLLPSVERVVNDFIIEALRLESEQGTNVDNYKAKGTKKLLPLKDSQLILLHRLAKYYAEKSPMAATKLFGKLLDEIAKNREEEVSWWHPCKKIKSYFSSNEKTTNHSSEYLKNSINQAIIMRDFAAAYCQLYYSGNRDFDLNRAEELAKTAYKIFEKELGKENPRTLGTYLILMHIRLNLKEDLATSKIHNDQTYMVEFIGSEPTINAAIALTGLNYESEDFEIFRKELSLPVKKSSSNSYQGYYDSIRAKYAEIKNANNVSSKEDL